MGVSTKTASHIFIIILILRSIQDKSFFSNVSYNRVHFKQGVPKVLGPLRNFELGFVGQQNLGIVSNKLFKLFRPR